MFYKKSKFGFTLIELLVVIAIIALLASIILIATNTARIRSRDAKRIADLRQIATAVSLYYSDNGHYPITGGAASCFDCTSASYLNQTITNPNAATIVAALQPYMAVVPKDPLNPHTSSYSGYIYTSDSSGLDYKVKAYITPENMNDFSTSEIDTQACPSFNSSTGQCTSGTNSVGYWTPGGAGF